MDALAISQIVLLFIIGVICFIKLRTTPSTSSKKTANQNDSDSPKSYCINSITKSLQYISDYIPFFKHTRNKCRNATNNKTVNYDDEDSFNHSKASIAGGENNDNQNRTIP